MSTTVMSSTAAGRVSRLAETVHEHTVRGHVEMHMNKNLKHD